MNDRRMVVVLVGRRQRAQVALRIPKRAAPRTAPRRMVPIESEPPPSSQAPQMVPMVHQHPTMAAIITRSRFLSAESGVDLLTCTGLTAVFSGFVSFLLSFFEPVDLAPGDSGSVVLAVYSLMPGA